MAVGSSSAIETVVLVHGLWFNGMEMGLMRARLRTAGFATEQFSYRSMEKTVAEHADDLNLFLATIESQTVHLLGHSLGGLVMRHLLARHPEQRPGRVVTLGTPHNGSGAARWIQSHRPLAPALGEAVYAGLDGNLPKWRADRALGVIAGTMTLGLGMVAGDAIERPNDGTVAVSETRLEGMDDHCEVHASHFGLLLSTRAVAQAIAFLRTGHFERL